ncbi:hypothetical protein EP232_01675 [bacterium]|nr:MAG: hypothetical protein EP232_01675 [bacterium]
MDSLHDNRGTVKSERGAALVIALFIIAVLTVLGVLVLNTSIVEVKMATNQRISSQVFYAAEAGLERALKVLIEDFENDTSPGNPWGNTTYAVAGTVTETAVTGSDTFVIATRTMDMYRNSPSVKKLNFTGGTTLGPTSYEVYIYKVNPTEVYIMSYGTGLGGVASVEYYLEVEDLSPYNNAIFTGSGIIGNFNGSVNVAGSIYSKGNVNPSGNVYMTNNYDDGYAIDVTLDGLLPSVTDLDAKLRVSGGNLTLDGSAQIGFGTSNGSVAGVYVDGTMDWGTATHHYDEFSNEVPDIDMPTILDGITGEFGNGILSTCGYSGSDAAVALSIYADWATGTGCDPTGTGTSAGAVITGDVIIDDSTASFAFSDGNGNGLFWDEPTDTLTVQGNVVIDGNLSVGENLGANKLETIEYVAKGPDTGSGSDDEAGATLFVGGNTVIEATFGPLSTGYLNGGNSTNSLGMITAGDLTFDGKNGDFYTGFYYAENQINFNKQSHFAGTVIGGVVNWSQVPNVYQVPNLATYLPPGMPGGYKIMAFTTRQWRRVY